MSVVSPAGIYETSPKSVSNGQQRQIQITADGKQVIDGAVTSTAAEGIADDAAFTPGTSKVIPAGLLFDDTAPDSVNEGDVGIQRMSANRNGYVTLRDAAGNERGLNVDANGVIGASLISGQSYLTAGAGAVAANTPRVTLASDDPLVAKSASLGAVSSATTSAVASAATSTQLLASNASRKGVLISNTDANVLRVKYGATASATSFAVAIAANGYWEMPQPIYTGVIEGIWDADGAGSAIITEM